MVKKNLNVQAQCLDCNQWHLVLGFASIAPFIVLCPTCKEFTPHDADTMKPTIET
jgi:ribosomal protein L44E